MSGNVLLLAFFLFCFCFSFLLSFFLNYFYFLLSDITFFLGGFNDCLFSLPRWCNLPCMPHSLLLQLIFQWTPWQLALFPTAVSYFPAVFYHFACILVITNWLLGLLFGALVISCWFCLSFPTDLFLNLYFVLYPVFIEDFWLWDSINQIQGTFATNFQFIQQNSLIILSTQSGSVGQKENEKK